MATCKQTSNELIQDVFSPCVAVICSSDVEHVCAKNNLTFVEMVQPFCRLNTEITIRDPNNMPSTIRNFRILMKDLQSQIPSPSVGKKMMYDAVLSNNTLSTEGVLTNTLTTENYNLKYCPSTPWYEAYRDVFFQVTVPTEHEFIHHYLSCIFVVSSSHQDPLSQINDLCQQQVQHQQNSSHNTRWFFSYVFNYYLLLHDVSSEDLAKAEAVYQSMKSSYGSSSCHLLQINSACRTDATSPNAQEEGNETVMPDPWSQFLPKYNVQNEKDVYSNIQVTEENVNSVSHTDEENDKNCEISSNNVKESPSIHHPLLNSDKPYGLDPALGVASEEEFNYSNKLSPLSNRNKRHGLCLTLSDLDRIKCFVQDFCIQALIPYVEKQVRILSDMVANRKGIHRTIFGVTKKFFAGNKPGMQSPTSSLNSVVYSQDAPELQVRKLGDLSFMFQLYEVAYQAYHNAKRDFSSDQAWLHFAGASEMAALSVFMQNSNLHEYPARYIESAITTYLHTCKMPDLATRATLLSSECLKAKGLYKEAATQFIRMPNEADLPSALCLEQAAHCYINCKPPKIRKYAFQIILAGHRFSKAGQRKHALRSYKQAEQVFKDLGWSFANNHINFTIGRFSVQLDQLDSAVSSFEPLLFSKCLLPAAEQASYLREYLFVLKRLINQKSENDVYSLPCLPVPTVCCESTKVLLSENSLTDDRGVLCVRGRGFDRGDINNNVWARLEGIVVMHVQQVQVYTHQLQCFTSKTDNTVKPNAILGETISVEISVQNPFSVALTIDNVYLLWTFTSKSVANNSEELVSVTNELDFSKAMSMNSFVEAKVLPHLIFEPLEDKKLHLFLIPHHVGELCVKGIAYSLLAQQFQSEGDVEDSSPKQPATLSLQGKQTITVKGARLNKTAKDRSEKSYADDYRLNLNIVSPMPKLEVKFDSFPKSLFCGEIQKVTATLTNTGKVKLHRIFVASPTPGIFTVGNPGDNEDAWTMFKEVPSNRSPSPVIVEWESQEWTVEIHTLDGGPCVLYPGESIVVPVWLKGHDTPGEDDLDLLFYYETQPLHPQLKYRLLQFSTVITTYPSVTIQSQAMRSFSYSDKSSSFHPAALPSSLLLALEMANISQELYQVSLVQISCISHDWCLLPTDDNCQTGQSVIRPGETLLLTFKAIGFKPSLTVSSQNAKVFSHIPMGRVEVDSNSTPCSDFTRKSMLNLQDSMLSSNSSLNSNSNKILELDCSEKEADLVLLLSIIWKAKVQRDGKDVVITGQQEVPIQSLTPSTLSKAASVENIDDIASVPIESENELPSTVPSDVGVSALLKCTLDHPFHVQHNFKLKRKVIVPVKFTVRSASSSVLKITLDNTHHESMISPTLDDSQNSISHAYLWVSGTKREIVVKPHNTVDVQLLAMFSAPGSYNLGTLDILVKLDEKSSLVYPMSPYLIIVSSCDTT